MQEIEAAIDSLSENEQEALTSRFLARRFGLSQLSDPEYDELLASLQEAEAEIDAGRKFTGHELRSTLPLWAGK